MLSHVARMSPVVRHRLPPSAGRPLPHRVPPILAEGIDDRAARGLERLPHLVVGGMHQLHLRSLVVGRLLAITSWRKLHRSYFR